MKIKKLILIVTVLALLALNSCSQDKSLYSNEVYKDVYRIDERIYFKIDMSLPIFVDKYLSLNKALQEQKKIYINAYNKECEFTSQTYQAEYGLPENMGFRITSEVETSGNAIFVTIWNEYYLAGAARNHIEVTTLKYDIETDIVKKEEDAIDGQKIEI